MGNLVGTLLAAAIGVGCSADAMAQAPVNSDRFDLSDWKLTLPTSQDGGQRRGGHGDDDDEDDDDDDDAAEVEGLAGYLNPDFFYVAADGAMVFVAPVDGVTTSGSRYPRSELREMRNGDEIAWTLDEGGTLSATLSVDAVPARHDGEPGRLIVGQIHGEDDELVRIYWQDDTVYFENEHAGEDDDEVEFKLENAEGETPDVALGEIFSYLIDARGDRLVVEVHADGQVYGSTTTISETWQSDVFYFKAGVYLGVNAESGTGIGQVSFHALDVGHTPGSGRGGLQ